MVITEVKDMEKDFVERLIRDNDTIYTISETAKNRQLSNLKKGIRVVDIIKRNKK